MLARAPNLSRHSAVRHGFTSRAGGVSVGPLATLNLAARAHESPAALAENWRRVATAVDPGLDPEAIAVLNQVHGAEVVGVARGAGGLVPVADADGSFTTERGVLLAVKVADCVPVLLAGPGVVGVAHAGWRGAAAGVAARAARAMIDAAEIRPGELAAAIGPCISGPSFEVGEEVVDGLRAAGVPREVYQHGASPRGRPLVDLPAVVAWQLAQLGVTDVWIDGRCTLRAPELWSHRRDGPEAGRFAGVIARVA